jgi:hypothetical protein
VLHLLLLCLQMLGKAFVFGRMRSRRPGRVSDGGRGCGRGRR